MLTTAQARKGAPSLINTNDMGRSGKEEDFQQWSKGNKAILRWSDHGVRNDVGVYL